MPERTKINRLIKLSFILAFSFSALLIGSALGWLTFMVLFNSPSEHGVEFVKACGELNNKQLTSQNIKSLRGYCSVAHNEKDGRVTVKTHACNGMAIEDYTSNLSDNSLTIYQEPNSFFGWMCLVEADENLEIRAVPTYLHD